MTPIQAMIDGAARRSTRAAGIAIAAALALTLAACGGSGGSTSGGAGFSSGKSTLSGNVQAVGGSVAAKFQTGDGVSLAMALLSAVPAASADGHLGGIEVCIENICTTTAADGSFSLDISSLESGIYSVTFQVGNVVYTYPLDEEISGESEIIIADVEIQASGVVTVGSITHNPGTDEGAETGEENESEETNPGTASGNITAAPENTSNGNGPVRIVICHKPGTPAEQTLILPEPAAQNGHLNHGDTLGACSGGGNGNEDGGEDEEGGETPPE